MESFLKEFFTVTQRAFNRRATHGWFIIVFAGLVLRDDWLGASSIVRALDLRPEAYWCLLNFFKSTAWSGPELLQCCVTWLLQRNLLILRNGRIIINGDETKTPKEGRQMPWVGTIRQTSETSSKPSYFRGHEWSMLGVLIGVGGRIFCAPAWAELMEPGQSDPNESRRTSDIVKAASKLALKLGYDAFLVLDAFYAAGTVFNAARNLKNIVIITRAKANCRAHPLAKPKEGKRGRGRPRKYEDSVRIADLYESPAVSFKSAQANVYGRTEDVSLYSIALFWKPAGALLLFVLAKTSRGTITLMCSDVNTNPVDILELYCHRSLIEVMFNRLKNLLGIMYYHFWSKSLKPQSRRPSKNPPKSRSTAAVEKKKRTISNFVHMGLVLLLFLQATACVFGKKVTEIADCWLRTPPGEIPSEFIVKVAMKNILRRFLLSSASNPIMKFIRSKIRPRSEIESL